MTFLIPPDLVAGSIFLKQHYNFPIFILFLFAGIILFGSGWLLAHPSSQNSPIAVLLVNTAIPALIDACKSHEASGLGAITLLVLLCKLVRTICDGRSVKVGDVVIGGGLPANTIRAIHAKQVDAQRE